MFGRIVCALVLVSAVMAGGCSSGSAGQRKFDSFTKTRGNLAEAQNDIDHTMATLSSLRMTDATNLGNAFKQYRDAVNRLDKRSTEAKRLAQATQENMDAHVLDWQKEMDSIHDPAIKASVESRREAVRSNYDQLKKTAADARSAYDAYLRDNQDIVKALSNDLSPAARTTLAPSMDRANEDGKALKTKVGAVQKALDNMANGRPPTG
jgi:chromosome segregation ATPase